MDNSKKQIIIIAGPTACGKTSVSVQLAKIAGGEIISADSMQVYRGMDIGTAKITKEEMQGIPHFMIDEFDPDEEFNVAVFQQRAKNYINDIYSRGKLPIIAGGTGFYINALVYDNDFTQPKEYPGIRAELKELSEKHGAGYMHDMLKEIDPDYAAAVHQNNIKKVIRAIEFYKINGRPLSRHNAMEKQREAAYDAKIFVLNMDRDRLYRRIEERIDLMMEQGLTDEVRRLLEHYSPDLVSMQGLGYKEFVPFFDGKCSLEEAVNDLKTSTRHFAKRQLTWFRHQCPGAVWVDMDQNDAGSAAELIYKTIKEK